MRKPTCFVSIACIHLNKLNDRIRALGIFREHHLLPLRALLVDRILMALIALKLKRKTKRRFYVNPLNCQANAKTLIKLFIIFFL